tara:strand:+ start:9850 stop:10461 length:612 start_codon:yes stop_codon:yes gene_type:complete
MLIHQLEINTTGLGITASVEANTGNTVERILAWNQQTFQDEAEAIDLSHLINGTDNIEITTISASDLGVSKIVGIWYVEFISSASAQSTRTDEYIIEPSAIGVASDLTIYHECVLDKALDMSISNCGATSKRGCTKPEDFLFLSALLESLGDAILFSLFLEAAQIAKTIESMCETCTSCPDYGIGISVSNYGHKTIEGKIVRT